MIQLVRFGAGELVERVHPGGDGDRPCSNRAGTLYVSGSVANDAHRARIDIPAQVATVFDVLSCLKTFASATYAEGGATVTHHKTVIQDIK